MNWTQITLAVFLSLYAGTFAAEMLLVERRTGSSPRGHSRGHPWAATATRLATCLLLGVAVAYAVEPRSVVWFGRIGFLENAASRVAAAALVSAAAGIHIWAAASLGTAFRIGLPEARVPLVTGGIYHRVRNPMAMSVDLLAAGVFLLAPSVVALFALLAVAAAFDCKVRIEESYLTGRHEETYLSYLRRTGRYFPRLFVGRPEGAEEAQARPSADYGTYIIPWNLTIPLSAALLLGGLAALTVPPWARCALLAAAALALLGAAFVLYLASVLRDDELKRRMRETLLSQLPWDGRGKALDIGTGTGLAAVGLALRFPEAHVVGCDTWQGGFAGFTRRRCGLNARAEGVEGRVAFEEGDAAALPYRSGELDAAVSLNVFHEVRQQKDKEVLIREALRVLRRGGAFAFQDPFGLRPIYGELGKLLEALRRDGLASVSYVPLRELGRIPLRLKPICIGQGILYGTKQGRPRLRAAAAPPHGPSSA